MIINKKSSELT